MATAIFAAPGADTSRRRRSPAPTAPRLERGDHWSESRDPGTGRKYFANVREPYINDATRAQINAAQADATYAAFWRLVFKEQAKGRTAAIRSSAWRLAALDDVGIKGLAREAGVHPSTTRRHLKILVEQIGIFGVGRSNVAIERDAATGKIVSKTGGRQKPIRIWFTPDERHSIPAAKARNPRKSYGAPCAIGSADGAAVMARRAPASREEEIKTTPPSADTVGVGAAEAEAEAPGLTAGEAGRQEAAEAGGLAAASQEGEARRATTHWPTADSPPHVAKPAPRAARPRSPDGQQEPPEKSFADRAAEWHRRDPEHDRIVAEYQAARRAKAASRPPAPSTADRPSGAIPGGRNEAPATIPFSEAADELAKLVADRRRQEADAARATQRDAYHRDRAQG